MANVTKNPNALTCMGCGAPIKSGFFCVKCEQGGAFDEAGSSDKRPAGSRFTGAAGRQKRRELLMEDLAVWAKRLLVLAILGGGGWLVWTNFGDRIQATVKRAGWFTQEHERYDPTRDAAVQDGDADLSTTKRPLSESKLGQPDPQ